MPNFLTRSSSYFMISANQTACYRGNGKKKTKVGQCARIKHTCGWPDNYDRGINMRNTIKLAMVGGVLAAGLASSEAQVFQTNLVTKINLSGTAYVQSSEGTVTKTRFTTKDALNRIAADNSITLSRGAKLIFELPQATSDDTVSVGPPVVSLQNGGDIIALGDNFNLFQLDGSVTVSDVRGRTETDYGNWRISFATSNVSFEAQGFATFKKSTSGRLTGSSVINFSGDGTVSGNPAVVTGKCSNSGSFVEAVEVQ